tara:strand:+ start:108 stop:317 length:210 start_codon:yes stop_codon:yes gene_type:complete
MLGRAYFYAEMDSNSIMALQYAIKYDSLLAEPHFFLGLLNVYADDVQNAELEFRKAIELDDRDIVNSCG